ncbi:MAG TPA: SRPBCC family protein [Verrucomicrobiae bacterium]|nr:SRPBCC family protein [Verrucomicrobiae bacterium]
MSAAKNNPAENTADREIVISREFAAPRELVWEAMTNPQHVANWWGPRGFSTTIEKMDFRTGGEWIHTMHGPDGANYPNRSVFQEIVKPEKIVFTHGGKREGRPGTNFISTWTFGALDANKTKVTIRMVFLSTAARDFVVKEFGAIEGGKQTLERLGEYLAKMLPK